MEHHSWADVVFLLVLSAGGWLSFAMSARNNAKLSYHDHKLDENTKVTREIKKIVNGQEGNDEKK
jgi:hypothetical protein